MTNDLDAQLAAANAELTALALTGGDTAKVRSKIFKLEELKKTANDAEEKARTARMALRAEESAKRGTAISLEVRHRLEAEGFAINDAELAQLDHYGDRVGAAEAEIAVAGDRHDAATQQVARIESRIAKLEERSRALAGLRLTDQASERDTNEALLLDKDLATLGVALAAAKRETEAAKVPDDLLRQRDHAIQQIDNLSKAVRIRILRERATAAEEEFLRYLRLLVQASGGAHPSTVYVRSAAFNRYVNYNVLF